MKVLINNFIKEFDYNSNQKFEIIYSKNSSISLNLLRNKKLFKLRKNKFENFNIKLDIKNGPILFYDESEFNFDDDEENKININFDNKSLEIIKLIKDFILHLKIENIKFLIVLSDYITNITKYESLFKENSILIFKISYDHFDYLKSFLEIKNTSFINLFSYKNPDLFFISKYKTDLDLLEVKSYQNESEYYLSLSKKLIFLFIDYNSLNTIIIHAVNLEQFKVIKSYFEKSIKLFNLYKEYAYNFITNSDILSSIEELIEDITNNINCHNLLKTVKQLILIYKIQFHSTENIYYYDLGKM